MSEINITTNQSFARIEEAALALLLILALIGVSITHFSPQNSFHYWLALAVFFPLCAIFIGWRQGVLAGQTDFKKTALLQSTHWFMLLVTLGAVFVLVKTGHLLPEQACVNVLLLMALATMLEGLRLGWRFSLIGFYLAILAIIIPYSPNFLWISILNTIILIVVVFIIEVLKNKQRVHL